MRTAAPPALRWLPVVLLAVGIGVSGFRVVAFHDDPQRGTSFAMFGTVDIAANRWVVATVPGDPAIELEVPERLRDEGHALAVAPTDEAARRFADLLLAERWTVDGDVAATGGDTALDDVRVQVVGPDAHGTTMTRQVLAEVVVQGSDE